MANRGYENAVEDLLNPEWFDPVDVDLLFRYLPGYEGPLFLVGYNAMGPRDVRSMRRRAYWTNAGEFVASGI